MYVQQPGTRNVTTTPALMRTPPMYQQQQQPMLFAPSATSSSQPMVRVRTDVMKTLGQPLSDPAMQAALSDLSGTKDAAERQKKTRSIVEGLSKLNEERLENLDKEITECDRLLAELKTQIQSQTTVSQLQRMRAKNWMTRRATALSHMKTVHDASCKIVWMRQNLDQLDFNHKSLELASQIPRQDIAQQQQGKLQVLFGRAPEKPEDVVDDKLDSLKNVFDSIVDMNALFRNHNEEPLDVETSDAIDSEMADFFGEHHETKSAFAPLRTKASSTATSTKVPTEKRPLIPTGSATSSSSSSGKPAKAKHASASIGDVKSMMT